MKVKTFLSIACLSLMLVGCGNNTVDNSGKSVESTNNKVSKVKHKKPKEDPREVVNGELLKVGQWCMMSRGKWSCTKFVCLGR